MHGRAHIGGSKNAALAVMCAALLCEGTVILQNIPRIGDVHDLCTLFSGLGVTTDFDGHTLTVRPDGIYTTTCRRPESGAIRASSYLLGALLGRYGHAEISAPGGCRIGKRPLNFHLDAFKALGARVRSRGGRIALALPEGGALEGANVALPYPSVGATINIMLAAVRAKGVTTIFGAAREPHVQDTAAFLNACGARIVGAGTDVIVLSGVPSLRQSTPYTVIADPMEAGTFMIYTCLLGGELELSGVNPAHLSAVCRVLEDMGAHIESEENGLYIRAEPPLAGARVVTAPYPGFPTDLQQPLAVLMSVARGKSTLEETVFENRFGIAEALKKMGADVRVHGNTLFFTGVDKLTAAPVEATDLRGGAALLGAALAAEGKTELTGEAHLFRGYEDILTKLDGMRAYT
jgi:UDP-N-acetylglucosamine 1-carboxyvinyltransferase